MADPVLVLLFIGGIGVAYYGFSSGQQGFGVVGVIIVGVGFLATLAMGAAYQNDVIDRLTRR